MEFPEALLGWKAWADRLGTQQLYLRDSFQRAAADLPEQTVEELGLFYDDALQSGTFELLKTWLEGNQGSGKFKEEEKAVRNLVLLFSELGKRDKVPFNSQRIRHSFL